MLALMQPPLFKSRQAADAGLLGMCFWLGLALLLPAGCAAQGERSLVVAASAYNSVKGQTSGDPTLAAWGDVLAPGMKAIAVSRDLLDLGLTHGTRVRIEGLPGEYRVLDKMARRWTRKIDIYMGNDVDAARTWGVREVRIYWQPPAAR
jgi:3D (Asp-Asp-Asp) domain-containing protein